MDEMLADDGTPRPVAAELMSLLDRLGHDELVDRQHLAELDILTMGITFTVYSDGANIDRAWPFDIIPRIISGREWSTIERGLVQRLVALNRFIDDVYNDRAIIRDGVFPADLLDENRAVAKRTFAEVFQRQSIRPVDAYTDELNKLLSSIAPDGVANPQIVVLTPGIFNSAYFEHSFLAQRMGAELVEGADLVVGDDDCVYMRTIAGLERVHVIYRRIDDLFLDPEAFRPDSMLGVPGLMRAWKAGTVGIANAPGAGVADDKVVYAWVPDMIRYYLGEEPLIPNVPTFRCMYPDERRHVIDNIGDLVLKPANESGGYGIVIGNRATPGELAAAVDAIEHDPRNWVAQPILSLSTVPTLVDGGIEPRHVDLRPFILTGARSYVTAGGLTRVALPKGSLVVNSSQGGGSKDTWIVDLHPAAGI
jgi:uncharacterized circularly permuted ATP-grasp superfamily protein